MDNFLGTDTLIEITYLIATALFILSLKWLSSPATARRGVFAGEAGMALAVGGTLLHRGIVDYKLIAIGLVVGTIIGIPLGRVQMTAVPQRTALSHAFGALCVTLVGTAEFYLRAPHIEPFMMAVLAMEVILGSLTFTGSLMAAGKLQEVLPQRPITYKRQNFVNLAMLGLAVAIAVILVIHPEQTRLFPAMISDSAVLWRDAGHPHRRGGHADGDLAVQFLRRTFRRGHGLCAEQQAADHRRGAGWFIGFHPFRDHVEGHEPFVHECVVRRVRANSSGRQQARRKRRRCAAPLQKRPPEFLPRQVKWSSFPATGWRWRKRNIRYANFTIR